LARRQRQHDKRLAAKSDQRRTYPATYRATIAIETLPAEAQPRETVPVAVTVTNVGTALWRAHFTPETDAHQVRLGLQLLDTASRVIDKDFARLDLVRDVGPGASCRVSGTFTAPVAPGEYGLKVDLVAEGVTWFEPVGTPAEIRPLRVG